MRIGQPGVRRWLAGMILLAPLLVSGKAQAQGAFYNPGAAEIAAGAPGTIIRSQPFDGVGVPGATTYRVLYRSTGLRGQPVAVSGLIIVPDTPVPAGGRKIVAWAHDTIGVARHCGPSLYPQALSWIPGLQLLLARGYVVTATDYEGLGGPGVHPYLFGNSAAKSVLDSVRAARNFSPARAGNHFAVWGHSQGAHAAIFAGQYARSYAPELRLAGVAAASTPVDIRDLFGSTASNPVGKMLGTFAIWSWTKVYRVPPSRVLAPTAPLVFERVARFCNDGPRGLMRLLNAAQPLEREGFLGVDILSTPRWKQFESENTPGRARIDAPVLLVQGTSDLVIRPASTAKLQSSLCRRGTNARVLTLFGAGHTTTAKAGAGAVADWIGERFAGVRAPGGC